MGTGRNTVTAFGKQTEKGTAADELKKLFATTNTLEDEIGTGQSDALTGVPFSTDTFVNTIGVGGNVGAELSTATFPEIVKYAIGAEDDDPVDLGDGYYKHVFTPDLTFDNWLTFLKEMKDEGYYELYKDCKINQFDLNVTGQAIITYTLAVLGISSDDTDGVADDLLTILENAGDKLYSWDVKLFWKFGTTGETDITADVNEFSSSNNNNLNGDKRGLKRERKSLDAQGRTHTTSISADFNKDDYMDFKAEAKQGNYVTFRVEVGEVEGHPILAIEYPKFMLSEAPTANINGPDDVTVSLNGNADWDTALGYNVKIEFVDEVATKY